jgi:hypothetical protein
MSKERAAKVMQEIFSKGTYEGDLLGINEGREMKDTVTYPLSAIIDECNHDLSEQETACADGFCPICATAELAEAREELNDKSKFCYAVEQALDGMKGDYVEIIVALRKEAERYRYVRSIWGFPDEKFNAAIDAAMKEGGK